MSYFAATSHIVFVVAQPRLIVSDFDAFLLEFADQCHFEQSIRIPLLSLTSLASGLASFFVVCVVMRLHLLFEEQRSPI
jgi:hypothetical protein